jgi:hypothetical protein
VSTLEPKPEPKPIVPTAPVDVHLRALRTGTVPAPLILRDNPDAVEAWRAFGPHLATFLDSVRVEQGYRDALYALADALDGLPEAVGEGDEEEAVEELASALAETPSSDHDDRMPEAV